MLEELAIKFVSQDEDKLGSIGLGITVLGFVVAAIVQSRSKGELQRSPYFAFSALLLLISSALTFMWILTEQAVARGVLWMLVGSVFLSIALMGYFYGVISLARSRDAFGTGRYAILALIPLANLVLHLKASKNALSPNRIPTISLLSGRTGIASGFVMAGASIVLSAGFQVQSDRMVENADPEQGIAFLVRSQGLDGALETIATESQIPIALDEVTTLASIKADGSRLMRTYVVTRGDFILTDQFRAKIQNTVCAYAPFTPLLRAGATIEEVYVKTDGSLIGAHAVTQHSCAS